MTSQDCFGHLHCQPISIEEDHEAVNNCTSAIATNKVKPSTENPDIIRSLLCSLPELDNCFHIHGKIGEGTFSNVYLASLKNVSIKKRFAIKHLIPTCHPKRIKHEVDCLNHIGGKDNVVSCEMTLRKADCVVLVMPYLQHEKFSDYVLDMTMEETRIYMKNLFLALKRVHSFKIIHRDIKPSNFLYNRDNRQFLLVDFGLAQKINETEDSDRLKVSVPKFTLTKRKREDDVENTGRSIMKRTLQTFHSDITTKYIGQTCTSLLPNFKQTTSNSQRLQQGLSDNFALGNTNNGVKDSKCSVNTMRRQPLTSNSTNIISLKKTFDTRETFQSLMPQKITSVDSGASYVRVQNSQVQPGLFPKPTAPVRRKEFCECKGKLQICNVCLTRKAQYAPRAGTPGFRPPEVLLKYPNQTTAVDMWSAGVIMLCILSGCYPFFRSPDDITALSELITVFGSTAIVALANRLGRNLVCNEKRKPLNLLLLCEGLRFRKVVGHKTSPSQPPPLCKECHHSVSLEYGCLCEDKCKLDLSNSFPVSAYDLLTKLLDLDPDTRISAEMALSHPFITATD